MKKMRFFLRAFVIAAFMPAVAFAEDFTINYELNGGTAASSGMPGTYTAGVETTIDGVPTRSGSNFVGWCLDSGLTDCAMQQTVSVTDTGDKTFYAKWTCNSGFHPADDGQSCVNNQYTVTYNCGTDVAGTPPASTTVMYRATFEPVMTLKNSCEKPGYILSGWLVSGTSDVKTGKFSWGYTSNKTLTAQWVEFDPKFTITTTNMSAGDTFKYWQGSKGLFYVDWGDGMLQTIDDRMLVSHTYESAGVHTIRFGGLATRHYIIGYNPAVSNSTSTGSITFGNFHIADSDDAQIDSRYSGTPLFISRISGSLGAIYPSLSVADLEYESQPMFISTFDGCTNLIGEIPANLFSGVTGGGAIDGCNQINKQLFHNTFRGCVNLGRDAVDGTSTYGIPATLFGDLNNAVPSMSMFQGTFRNCSGVIGSIPGNLFDGVAGVPNAGTFHATFSGCSGLTGSIPENLFENISGDVSTVSIRCGRTSGYTIGGVSYTIGAVSAFGKTFAECSGLASIPENLFGRVVNGNFSGITGSVPYLFNGTFNGIQGVTSIPENLFGRVVNGTYYGVTGAAESMFGFTFQGMCSLQSIPSNLFAGVSGTAADMFHGTFNMGRCGVNGGRGLPESGLTGYVDPVLFAGVTASSTDIFTTTFRNTHIDTTCPCGAHSATTAWGINTIPASNTYNPANDPTGKDAPRAVCVPGLKTLSRDGVNEYYYDGDQSKCVTGCGYSLNLQQSGAENPLSYSLVKQNVVNPSMALQIGDDRCYLPFSQNSSSVGVAGELNMKMGNNYYHPGEMGTD